jgi:hypothetical protein
VQLKEEDEVEERLAFLSFPSFFFFRRVVAVVVVLVVASNCFIAVCVVV